MFEALDNVYFSYPAYIRIPFAVGLLVLLMVAWEVWRNTKPPQGLGG